MPKPGISAIGRWFRRLLPAVLCLSCGLPPAQAQNAATLSTQYGNLRDQLASNQFQRPLHLESSENAGKLSGDVHALLDQPYGVVASALQGIGPWCDILILHLNVKSCRAAAAVSGNLLSVRIGGKSQKTLADTHSIVFHHQLVAATPGYLQILLTAEKGPMGTSSYRIMLEIMPLDASRSFLHLSYSYAYGMSARIATQGYLATIGRDKLGFSIIGHESDGQPIYLRGMRGVVERNAMRYYLAIEAYLGALATPLAQRSDKRLNDWYAGVERHPLQLHELERDEYLDMKRREIERDRAAVS